jgi:hypothetical protein
VLPGSLVQLAHSGQLVSWRDDGGALWFDRTCLDERFPLRSFDVDLAQPFW